MPNSDGFGDESDEEVEEKRPKVPSGPRLRVIRQPNVKLVLFSRDENIKNFKLSNFLIFQLPLDSRPKPPVRSKTTEDLEKEVLAKELEVVRLQKEVWSTANEVLKTVGDKIQLLINLQPVNIETETVTDS